MPGGVSHPDARGSPDPASCSIEERPLARGGIPPRGPSRCALGHQECPRPSDEKEQLPRPATGRLDPDAAYGPRGEGQSHGVAVGKKKGSDRGDRGEVPHAQDASLFAAVLKEREERLGGGGARGTLPPGTAPPVPPQPKVHQRRSYPAAKYRPNAARTSPWWTAPFRSAEAVSCRDNRTVSIHSQGSNLGAPARSAPAARKVWHRFFWGAGLGVTNPRLYRSRSTEISRSEYFRSLCNNVHSDRMVVHSIPEDAVVPPTGLPG